MYILPDWVALLLGIVVGIAIYRGMRTGSLVRYFKDAFNESNKKDYDGNRSLQNK